MDVDVFCGLWMCVVDVDVWCGCGCVVWMWMCGVDVDVWCGCGCGCIVPMCCTWLCSVDSLHMALFCRCVAHGFVLSIRSSEKEQRKKQNRESDR